MARIWIIEDDEIMAECLMRATNNGLLKIDQNVHLEHNFRFFSNAIDAVGFLNDEIPDLIILDILLSGPDGFTFLNELMSYHDTVNIPVVIVTSLELSSDDLSQYNVVEVLHKETMTPPEIKFTVERALKNVH